MAKLMTTVLMILVISGCAAQVQDDPRTEPDCSPGNVDVMRVITPAAIELGDECIETLNDEGTHPGGRTWCCWKGARVLP